MRRRSFNTSLLAGLGATAASGTLAARTTASGAAPGFEHVNTWLNANSAGDVLALDGRVTLVNFWTYSCINVIRTVPYLSRWHEEYGAAGLQVVGIHTPEFGFEHLRENVEFGMQELGIRYPVGQDNGYRTWRAWANRAWPSFYLLDRNSRIVLKREGEGHAIELERAIRGLLSLPPRQVLRVPPDDADLSRIRSPEVYFGAAHPTPQEAAQSPRRGEASYTFSRSGPSLNRYELDGRWAREDETLILRSNRGALRMRYSAAKVHVVASQPNPAAVQVRSRADVRHTTLIGRPALYTVVDSDTYADAMIEIEATSPGLTLYSATFG